MILGSGCMAFLMLCGCRSDKERYDATGTFEATEVTVSAETQGRILALMVNEGDTVAVNQPAGAIDSLQLVLQKEQLIASHRAVDARSIDIGTQIAALREQIGKQQREKTRFENLRRANAATQKQVDDINAQLVVLERELEAQLSNLRKNNSGIKNESEAVVYQIARFCDLIRKCNIVSPVSGTVIAKYAEAGEFAVPGTPLFKIADLKTPFLRAYVTSEQLTSVRINQQVEVIADFGAGYLRTYRGTVSWIGDKAEFTPKGIQTRNERASQVYPVKIRLENDGYIKSGMYGGVRFKS